MNRLRNIPVYLGRKGKVPRFSSIKYPSVPLDVNDIYITTTVGDRLDSLSNQFYNSVDFWWIIARANPDLFPKDSFALKPGLQIRIPANYQSIVDEFYRINENR